MDAIVLKPLVGPPMHAGNHDDHDVALARAAGFRRDSGGRVDAARAVRLGPKLTLARRAAISRAKFGAWLRPRRPQGINMSGCELSSAGLDARRRRALFRAWRRGVREMDLVMGRFADMNLPGMDEADLSAFERLLDVPDPQVLAWITGEAPTPQEFDTPMFARLRDAPRQALIKEAAET